MGGKWRYFSTSSRSGTFDEHNCQLKQGAGTYVVTPNPFAVKDGSVRNSN